MLDKDLRDKLIRLIGTPSDEKRMLDRATPAEERIAYWWDRSTVWLVTARDPQLLAHQSEDMQRSLLTITPNQSCVALIQLGWALCDANMIDRLESLTNPHEIPGRALAIELLRRSVRIGRDNPKHTLDAPQLRQLRNRICALGGDAAAYSARQVLGDPDEDSLLREVLGKLTEDADAPLVVSTRPASTPLCPVRITETKTGRGLEVLTETGGWKGVVGVTPAGFECVTALVAAFPDGRTALQLEENAAVEDPGRALRQARDADSDLCSVLEFPGQAHRGTKKKSNAGLYRIKPLELERRM